MTMKKLRRNLFGASAPALFFALALVVVVSHHRGRAATMPAAPTTASPTVPAAAGPVTPDPPPVAPALTYGSQPILDACWSATDLTGSPAEMQSRVDPNPFAGPPDRATPTNSPPRTPLPVDRCRSIRSVVPRDGRKVAALTFDLCEGGGERTGYDAAIVDYLRAHRVRATFFAGGRWLHDHPERAMQLMADPLFEIGAHGWSHRDLRGLTGAALSDQIWWTQGQYELLWEELSRRPCAAGFGPAELEAIPKVPLVFRFPYGSCSPAALDFVNRAGLPAIQWSLVTGDPAKGRTAAGIVATVMSAIRPGAIIIGHANGRGHGTAQALAIFVPRLRAQGDEFVTVSELLEAGTPVATDDCYSVRPGDTWNLSRPKKLKGKK
jgi:peptidoglycan-N-acetylglucosamine deacetylase